jgi:branched-chain amino acid aminotransferase
MIVYLNGKFVEEKLAHISIWDAGFLFGEGIFTTLRLYQGVAHDLEAHWNRLQHQARFLDIPCPLALEETSSITTTLVNQNGLQKTDSRLRITLTRGGDPDNPLPVALSSGQPPTILLTIKPLPASIDEMGKKGIAAIILGPEFLRAHYPQLKSLNYLPPLLALREARNHGCCEAIVLDEKGLVTEGAASNVFMVKNGQMWTPANTGNILPGLTRQRVIDIAGQNNLTCIEKELNRDDLENADEVFLCNSIRQIIPVIGLGDTLMGDGLPGPITRQISAWYNTAMHQK